MPINIGTMERAFRTVVGLYLIAFATGFGFPTTSVNWIGWVGAIPLATAIFGFCPFYRLLGRSSQEAPGQTRSSVDRPTG
jgi:membrane-associated protease RseP (regulator of RpoE activity)